MLKASSFQTFVKNEKWIILNSCLCSNASGNHMTFSPQQNFTDSLVVSERCGTREELLLLGCPQEFIQFPVNTMELLADRPLGKSAGPTNMSYISPQKMVLDLRPGEMSSMQI